MRFIINLGKRSTVTFRTPRRRGRPAGPPTTLTFKPVNEVLGGVYQVLKMEASRQPGLLGSSVYGYNDTFCRLQPFVRRWRAAAATAAAVAGAPPAAHPGALTPVPHIVSLDVTRAFDHVDIRTLLSLVEPLLQSEHYLVLKYTEVVPSLGAVQVIQRRVAIAGGPEAVDFPLRAAQLAASAKNKVFTDQVVYERISREQALALLRQHLTANVVRLRREWHYQSRGIAQGGTLSTLLCCLYLAHVERACINPIIASGGALAPRGGGNHSSGAGTTSHGCLTTLARAVDSSASARGSASAARAPRPGAFSQSLLLRLVDDWLLVTPSAAVARGVAHSVMAGFPQYNVVVNPEKSKLSFPLTMGDGRRVEPGWWDAGDGRRFIKWCGLLVNVESLEIQGDYTR
jgi:telomerase reverse transcriptase